MATILCVHSVDFPAAAARSVLAEVGYRGADGRPAAVVLVPLILDQQVCFALPYGHRGVAEELAASADVVVVCSEGRLALRDWRPAAASGRVELRADPRGECFRAGLLDQELRKHPPARLLADSLLLQRDHWWYLPRLLLTLDVSSTWEVAPRTSATQGVLVWQQDDRMTAAPAATDDPDALTIMLTSLDDRPLPSHGEVCLILHDSSLPDLDRRTTLTVHGELEPGGILRVRGRDGSLALPPPGGVLARWRTARAFERACRRELRR